ncbi:hypothetical protein BsWGS_16632 [Bradybaena similaris]
MASRAGWSRQLARVRCQFVEELDINTLLPRLLVKRLFTLFEEKEILSPALPQKRVEVLLDVLSRKGRQVFVEFCRSLEELAPHLLTALVLESQEPGTVASISVFVDGPSVGVTRTRYSCKYLCVC